jgi:hypothetical protein
VRQEKKEREKERGEREERERETIPLVFFSLASAEK